MNLTVENVLLIGSMLLYGNLNSYKLVILNFLFSIERHW